MQNFLVKDLDYILGQTKGLWEEIRNKRIFITGGTGFIGCWLLESFVWANERLGLNANALVLTRRLELFQQKAPHLAAHPALQFYEGDVRNFDFPSGEFSHVIHAATEASPQLQADAPHTLLDGIMQGTKHTLDFAVFCNAEKILLTSSGAVYGKQPPEITHIAESYMGAPDTMQSASTYGEGKRVAELMCALYAQKYKLESKIARCFAFVGPYLPLDKHFAIGNFIRDAMSGNAVTITGDGSPYRSYLYAADLAICLWTILFKGINCYPYNVGSEKDLTIKSLAKEVACVVAPNTEIKVLKQPLSGNPLERYVPSTQRLQKELGIDQHINLQDAIRRTTLWYSNISKSRTQEGEA